EKQFKVGRLQKRLDIAVYNTQIHPVMLVECKAPHVKLHQKIIEQSLRYNLTLQVSYLLITNGISHYAYQLDYASQRMIPLKVLPDYQTMIKGCEV
ncbi:MAG: restriction endonuclease subunit R, partial [Bacteroidetes bacterium]